MHVQVETEFAQVLRLRDGRAEHRCDASREEPGQVRAQKAGIGGFISEAPDGGQSHIDRGGREVLLFEKEPVPEDDRPVKCKTWFGTVPPDKFVDGVTV